MDEMAHGGPMKDIDQMGEKLSGLKSINIQQEFSENPNKKGHWTEKSTEVIEDIDFNPLSNLMESHMRPPKLGLLPPSGSHMPQTSGFSTFDKPEDNQAIKNELKGSPVLEIGGPDVMHMQ